MRLHDSHRGQTTPYPKGCNAAGVLVPGEAPHAPISNKVRGRLSSTRHGNR